MKHYDLPKRLAVKALHAADKELRAQHAAVLVEYANSTTCTWEIELTKGEANARAEALTRQYGSHARVSVVPGFELSKLKSGSAQS